MADTGFSPRVNAARMPYFKGQTVRLPCKIGHFDGDFANVTAADGGVVRIHIPNGDSSLASCDTHAEIIGTVTDENSMKLLLALDLGKDIDLSIVQRVIDITHDPRFFSSIFSPAPAE